MKRRVYFLQVLLSLALMAVIVSSSAAYTPFPRAKGLDVGSIVPDPFAYKGEVKVRGAVSTVEAGKKTFTIIDYREYRACRRIDCANEEIMVFFGGKPPEVENVVEITGVIEKNPAGKGGFVLRAKTVSVK
jgi:hypothetical protein